ncbi:MAG: response regulator, partial [Bacteroidota bacterium]
MVEKSILIVDDLFPNRFLIKEIIKSLSYSCAECENGQECIEYLQQHVPRIILMDIEMPVMNGLETTKYIREHFTPPVSNIPIIALTAHNPDI